MDAGPATGQHFGSYRLLGELGRGGMGVVYRAEHEHLQRVVALKLLTPDLAESPGFRERFQRESRLAASVDHANIVPVYDAGDIGGTLYLAMRFIEGTDLAAVLAREGRLAPERAARVIGEVASALDAAHARGLVHRDVKPANVMIDAERCYLTDFGLTKPFAAEATALTQAGQFLGTADYVAPEQVEGRPLDGRADVYSLGCVLYECVTGARPYPRPAGVAVLYAHLREPAPRATEAAPGLPPAIDAVIATAMAKNPDERYRTAGDLAAAARAALARPAPPPTAARTPVAAAPPTAPAVTPTLPPPTVPRPPTAATGELHTYRRRQRRAGIVAGLVALAVAVAAAVLLLAGGDEGGEPSQPRVAGEPLEVGERPFGVSFAGGSLWVANNSSDTVTRLSPDGGERETIKVPVQPFGTAATEDDVFVANSDAGSVTRIDAETGAVGESVDVGESPFFVAAEGDSVWVSNGGESSVTELGGDTIEVGSRPRGIAVRDGVVWVASKDDGTVDRIEDGAVTDTIDVGSNPVGVALSDDALWVANEESASVSRIELSDPGAGAREIPVGEAPFGIASGEGYVWVANSGEDTVMRLDPDTGERVGPPIPVPGQPVGVAVADGSVWVTANDRNALVRIDP
jgi:YVTN family beta-propeller protein